MVSLHRILSGSPEHRAELVAAGIFVMVWFAMDLVQWVDWLNTKIAPAPVVCANGPPADKEPLAEGAALFPGQSVTCYPPSMGHSWRCYRP